MDVCNTQVILPSFSLCITAVCDPKHPASSPYYQHQHLPSSHNNIDCFTAVHQTNDIPSLLPWNMCWFHQAVSPALLSRVFKFLKYAPCTLHLFGPLILLVLTITITITTSSLSLPLADCLHRPQRYSGIIETSSSNSFGGSIFLRLDYLHATEMELICIYSHLFIHIYIYIYSSYW